MSEPTEEEPGKELLPGSKSIVQIRIGNRDYSMVRHTRCAVCMHPGRYAIEEKILLNFGYPAIVRFVSEVEHRNDDGEVVEWPALTRMQLINHREKGHIGLNSEMIRELAERRARDQGIDLENHMGQFVDHVVASDIILERGMERLIKGEIQPDVKDVLAVTKLKQELEATNKQYASLEQMQDLIVVYFSTVKRIVGEEKWKAIMKEIQNHPAVIRIQQQRQIEG